MDFRSTTGRKEGRRKKRGGGGESARPCCEIRRPQAPSLHLRLSIAALMETTPRLPDTLVADEERRVAEILLELPKLLEPLGSPSAIRWGSTGRRSSFPTAPSPSCGSERILSKAEAASPAIPLSFSPGDKDEYSRPKIFTRRNVRKKSHKELKEEVARLCAERVQLELEYRKRSKYWNELQALNLRLNSQLKERENQLSLQAFYRPHLSQCRRSLDLIGNLTVAAAIDEGQQHTSLASVMPSGPGISASEENYSMAVGILDLNAPPKEPISFHFIQIPVQLEKKKAAVAADARKKRIEVNRGKSSLGFKQSRLG